MIAQQICFTNQPSFHQPLVVRTSFAVWTLLTAAVCCVDAQDQEKKLVDRLLKPDMALQNDAQNKKFSGDGSASINKRANVGTFFIHQKPSSKNYSGTRDFSTTQFYSQTYRGGRTAHEASSQQTLANSKASYGTQTARGVRDALSPGKRSPLVRMQVTGRFWTKAQIKSRSTDTTSRSRSSRCASC